MHYPDEPTFETLEETGRHRLVRSTGTDRQAIAPAVMEFEGVENQDDRLTNPEPEDYLPDELDHNK